MEGTPSSALYLLRAARTLASRGQHRRAALLYSATARTLGVSPRVQAIALFDSADQLYASSTSSLSQQTRDEDRKRAIQFLQKCAILLRSQPDSFDMRMKVAALLGNIYTSSSDHHTAAKSIMMGLEGIERCRDADHSQIWKWWIYFRTRAVSNAVAKDSTMEKAMQLSLTSAGECARHGEKLAAAGFYLAHCQIALSLPVSNGTDLSPALRNARECLDTLNATDSVNCSDFLVLDFCFCLLRSLEYLRRGDLEEAKANITPKLRKAYNKVRQLYRNGTRNGSWEWIPPEIITALTFHVSAAVHRGSVENSKTLVYASTALSKVGVKMDSIHILDRHNISVPGISKLGHVALVVAFLESAARFHLGKVDLSSASTVISAAVNLAFADQTSRAELLHIERGEPHNIVTILPDSLPTVELIFRCSVLLLCAEYHCLRGWISGARVSTKLLEVIRSTSTRFRNHAEKEIVTDTWQMAQSYLSLLLGDCRPGVITQVITTDRTRSVRSKSSPSLDTRFASKHVLGVAWFAIGVFHMRRSDIIESRKALRVALSMVSAISGYNEQVVANTLVMQSSLDLTHERISEDTCKMVNSALALAQAMSDHVTVARATRHYVKMARRMGVSPGEISSAEERNTQATAKLNESRDRASRNLVVESHDLTGK